MTTTDPQPATLTRTDEELTNLAQAVEEAGLPELGPAQGRLFDAVAFGLVHRDPAGIDWRTDGPRPTKCGPLVARVEKKGLVYLAVEPGAEGRRWWFLTDPTGVQMNDIRNPEPPGVDAPAADQQPATVEAAHPEPPEELLAVDTALGSIDDTCIGRTRDELRSSFTGMSASDLWHYAGQLKIKLRKAARKSELVAAILDAGFQSI